MDMRFKATKRRRRKFEPRVRVWEFKEEKTCEDYRCRVGGKVEEAKWKGLGVNDHWQLVVPDQRPLNGCCCCCVVLAV